LSPAIKAADFDVVVAANDPAPVPIGESILSHLATAPMAVFDLGGFGAADDVANPNVMYELGVRHAFGLPAIVYSPTDRLPFDVLPGRAVIAPRRLELARGVRDQLTEQIKSAVSKKFWRPMEAVGRFARLQHLAEAGHMRPIVEQLQRLSATIEAMQAEQRRQQSSIATINPGTAFYSGANLGRIRMGAPSGVVTIVDNDYDAAYRAAILEQLEDEPKANEGPIIAKPNEPEDENGS
jgi:hypothetical protein